MSEDGRQPGRGRTRTLGLLVWAVLGWSWLWFWPPYGAFHRVGEGIQQATRRRQDGASYGLAADAHAVLAQAVLAPSRVAELVGENEGTLESRSTCALAWTDDEHTVVTATRAYDAQPATGWMALTRPGQATVGRYGMGLWTDHCDSEGATRLSSPMECTRLKQLRLLDRQVSSRQGTGEERILPGQCVLGIMDGGETAKTSSDRYVVHLPAHKTVTVRLFTIPAALALHPRLVRDGAEIAPLPDVFGAFATGPEGDYEILVERDPRFPAVPIAGQYTLQVHWGKADGQRCPIPDFDGRDCYHHQKNPARGMNP